MNKLILFLVSLLFINIYIIRATEYNVVKSDDNLVKFYSDAPIEDFEGVTSKIDGYLLCDKNDLAKNSEIYFEVQLNTLKTGISLRDRHMRENYLHTDKYPIASFKGKIIEANKNGNVWDVKVNGEMNIHGVKKSISIKGELKNTKKGYKISTTFFVALKDYNIEIPSLMFAKINENIKLELKFEVEEVN